MKTHKRKLVSIPLPLNDNLETYARYHGVPVMDTIIRAITEYISTRPLEFPRTDSERQFNDMASKHQQETAVTNSNLQVPRAPEPKTTFIREGGKART